MSQTRNAKSARKSPQDACKLAIYLGDTPCFTFGEKRCALSSEWKGPAQLDRLYRELRFAEICLEQDRAHKSPAGDLVKPILTWCKRRSVPCMLVQTSKEYVRGWGDGSDPEELSEAMALHRCVWKADKPTRRLIKKPVKTKRLA
jgi:hypothetical protein